MSFLWARDKEFARFEVPLPAMLETALARLQRQARYARPLSKGGRSAASVQALLDRAADCVSALARPEAVLMPVRAEPATGGIRIADRVTLDGDDLASDVARGGAVTAYLLTLNYDQARAFDWLEGDYAVHHVQSDLGSEVLFALGRRAFELQKAQAPGARMRRVPVQAGSHCGQRRFWDPRRVQALLGVFEGANPGVTVSDTGCFHPLNSLLGLTIRI